MEKRKKKKKRGLKHLLTVLTNLLVVVTAALFLVNYGAYYVRESGYGMEPAIGRGSGVLVNRILYRITEPKRFDVAAFRQKDGTLQIKRIVGMPGEQIQIKDGQIYIDGRLLTEASAYIGTIEIAGYAAEPIVLGEDEYFVLGDNPERSQDSRFAGTGNIKREDLAGRAWFYVRSVLEFGFL